nr:AAA family ATPase [Kineococcus siccus]
MRARRDAQDQLRAEQEALLPDDVDAGTLGELLAREPAPPARIRGLLPAGGRATLVAARKAGKTTATANLARCLLTGEPFLGRFPVRPLRASQRVGILNYEVSAHQMAVWLDEHGVDHDRIWVRNLRGRRNPLASAHGREKLVDQLRAARVGFLIVDVFGRAFTGEDQDSNSQVGRFLAQGIDVVLQNADVDEALLTVHAGWNGERTRGASALEDWPDAIWKLTRPGDPDRDEHAIRFFSAEGRDVDVAEDALAFDVSTRTLTLTGAGGRHAARARSNDQDLLAELLPLLAVQDGLWVGELERRLAAHRGHGVKNGSVRQALEYGLQSGQLTSTPGHNRRVHWHLAQDQEPGADQPEARLLELPQAATEAAAQPGRVS